LSLECLFADKLTTLGPTTIGIPDDRADEQFKQLYDVIALFVSNVDRIISSQEKIKSFYEKISRIESRIHNIAYDPEALLQDMKSFIDRVRSIENDKVFLNRANDFQSLYLRKGVNRDKAQWAIVGFQLDLLVKYLFKSSTMLPSFNAITELSEKLSFSEIRGPERRQMVDDARSKLQAAFSDLKGLSVDVFKKRLDRIVWEIATFVPVNIIYDSVKPLVP